MLDASSVEIPLDGGKVTLTCTIESVVVLNKAYGGLWPLYERVKQLDLEAMTVVVRAGAMIDGSEAEKLLGKVYKTGLVTLQPYISEFILLAATGGVRPDKSNSDEDQESEAKPGKN